MNKIASAREKAEVECLKKKEDAESKKLERAQKKADQEREKA
jgi:hypothetical protein